MKITAADVGRVAVDRAGTEWKIVAVGFDDVYPVTARRGTRSVTYMTNGRYHAIHERQPDLIRFADEEQKPRLRRWRLSMVSMAMQ